MTLVDLTHALAADVYNPPGFPPVRVEQLPCPSGAILRDTRIDLVVHVGTHIDAPLHLTGRKQDAAHLRLFTTFLEHARRFRRASPELDERTPCTT